MSKTRIIDAVRHLDLDETRNLLTANPALLTVTDCQGRNLLHLTCSVHCPAFSLPESAAASPDIADRDGATARVKASRKRDKKWQAALS
jgi:hypothetical protein